MTIKPISWKCHSILYPYKFRIEIPYTNLTQVEDVKDWATDTGFDCIITPGIVYVPEEKDAVWFILRWS